MKKEKLKKKEKKNQKQRHTGIVGGELLEKPETFPLDFPVGAEFLHPDLQSIVINSYVRSGGYPQPPVHGRDVR